MKLSEAIRRGHTMIGETVSFMPSNREWREGGASGCALCAAWLGIGNTVEGYWHRRIQGESRYKIFPSALGISEELMNDISRKHCDGMKRLEIADWIEREYESKLPQKQRESDDSYTKRILQSIIEGAERPRVTA